jgi:hypothetical protein
MTQQQRNQKRFKRENRASKGEAQQKRLHAAHAAARLDHARREFPWQSDADALALYGLLSPKGKR